MESQDKLQIVADQYRQRFCMEEPSSCTLSSFTTVFLWFQFIFNWLVIFHARNAALANSYFVGSINRVGTEVFPNPFTSGDGKPQHCDSGHFYGSSHFSAPDASCTPSLSRYRDGLLISDMDLNLCRQLKDKWVFRMTARYDVYSKLLSQYLKPGFSPQVIVDPYCISKFRHGGIIAESDD